MRSLTLTFVLTAAFTVNMGMPAVRAASIMAPVHTGLQTCAAQIGALIQTDYQPDQAATCCTQESRCGALLSTVEPRTKAPKHT